MKKISVLFVAIVSLSVGKMSAQKIASMDYESVISAMPEAKKMTTDLDALTKAKSDELDKQAAAFQGEVEAYQKGAAALTEDQRKAKEAELQKKQQTLQQLSVTAQTDLNTKKQAALKPIVDKINAAVEKVAKANNFEFILDASAIIYKGGADATPLVKKELGL